MGGWEDVTRLVYTATANGREVACCLTSHSLITGAKPKLFGANTCVFLHIKIMYLNACLRPNLVAYIEVTKKISCS